LNQFEPVMEKELLAILRSHFGFDTFRPGQEEAIQHLLAGQHTLAVMPTGAGKSLIYQFAALRRPGVTLVISPLIALMKDQVDSLQRRNIPATFINSTLSPGEQASRLQAMAKGAFRLVYIAPERLRSTSFLQALRRIKIGLLAIDEAHCVSEWGHDFRPDFLQIAPARQELGDPLIIALTATATPQLQDDIVRLLQLPSAHRVVTGFNRPNLAFEVCYAPEETAKKQALKNLLTNLKDGRAIVYAGTRPAAEEVAKFVREKCNIAVEHYHAGVITDKRTSIQDAFMKGELPVVVATNAFGMGIDRPDVRMVLHFNMPGTLEAYYQEAGRAGRDGKPARAVLLYDPDDRALQEWFIENDAPSPGELLALYQAIRAPGKTETRVAASALCAATGLHEVKVRLGLAQLEATGIIQRLGDVGMQMMLRPGQWNEKAVRKLSERTLEHRRYRRAQLRKMIAYAESNACRRRIILDHFGDRSPAEAPICCDNCQARQKPSSQQPRGDFNKLSPIEQTALIILDAVRRLKWETGREKLAQMLQGAKVKAMQQFGYDQTPYYGRLSTFSVDEIKDCIEQLIALSYLKVIGGNRPVLRLMPEGYSAIKARAAIPLRMPNPPAPAEQEISETIAMTASLFNNGLEPEAIAAQRELSARTVFQHLAWLIGADEVPLDAVVPDEIATQVRAAIAQVGDVSKLVPIKALLPSTIPYEQIRCVVEDWKRQQALAQLQTAPSSKDRIPRIVQLGEERSPSAVPELTAALQDQDGNVRRLAASALGKIGDARAVQPLMVLLQNETKPQVRQYAVKALGKIGDPRARRLLEQIAADASEQDYTQEAARTALRRLSEGLE
jgi:ATP-dependent DNA helicase RecQ